MAGFGRMRRLLLYYYLYNYIAGKREEHDGKKYILNRIYGSGEKHGFPGSEKNVPYGTDRDGSGN